MESGLVASEALLSVYPWIRALAGPYGEDCVQDCCAWFLKKYPTYDSERSALTTWTARLVKRRIVYWRWDNRLIRVPHYKRWRKEYDKIKQQLVIDYVAPDTEPVVDIQELMNGAGLTWREWLILSRIMFGLLEREIGSELDITDERVRQIKKVALNKLDQYYAHLRRTNI